VQTQQNDASKLRTCNVRSTQSEVVVPIVTTVAGQVKLLAVLDIDSDHPAAFDKVSGTAECHVHSFELRT
jgi:putative methionine-R-sulfoxide reductase with GAF domain